MAQAFHISILLSLTVALCTATVGAAGPPSPPRAPSGSAPTYVVRDLGTLGGSLTSAWGINERGEVVGVSTTADEQGHGFVWWNGVMTDLGEGSQAIAINARGVAVGFTHVPFSRPFQATRWKDGVATDLGAFGDYLNSRASLVNERGQVIIRAWTGTTASSFLWEEGSRVDLGDLAVEDINDRGEVVGNLYDGSRGHGAMWRDGVTTILAPAPDYTDSWVRAINNQGQAVGASVDSTVSTVSVHACVWTRGEVHDLGTLGGERSAAFGINNRGQIVGYSVTVEGETHAALWTDGEMIDLGTLGGSSSLAFQINDRGQVLGSSTTPSGEHHLFLWEKGVMADLWPWSRAGGGIGASAAGFSELNARGEVAGRCLTADDQIHACIRQLEGGSASP